MTDSATIPIQNLYYLLCYAWDRLEEGGLIDVSGVQSDAPVDLLAVMLIKGIEHVIRRGLNKAYIIEDGILSSIRGRVDILNTERKFLRQNARVACSYDELTLDTQANRILKSTLRLLANDPDLNRDHRASLRRLIGTFQSVQDVRTGVHSFRTLQFDRNSSFYRFLLNICQLVQSVEIPLEGDGRYRFREFFRDEVKMALLFQNFVYNFLKLERRDLSVFRENISWTLDVGSPGNPALLPNMSTDISVVQDGKRTIIDTKYYREMWSSFYGSQKYRSENLYQMFSYLANARKEDEEIEGILLYPKVSAASKERYSILGHTIRIETIDLGESWDNIDRSIRTLLPG
jgi:5-methylcytosine-specific restriction enzyme subunit McrC